MSKICCSYCSYFTHKILSYFLHFVASSCVSFLLIVSQCECMCCICLIHSFIEGDLGCINVPVISNKATVNILENINRIFFFGEGFTFSGYLPKFRIACQMAYPFLNLDYFLYTHQEYNRVPFLPSLHFCWGSF